jgi:site-specific DNA recombinase
VNLTAYIRVSRVGGREGDSFISPAVQRERIAAYATAHGHAITDWITDLDESGGKVDRPGFQEALERCEAGDAQGVIVAKLDRFARSSTDAAVAIKRLEAAGCQLVSVADNLDTATPVGRFARTMMLAIAELERERITEAWEDARSRAIGRGVHIARTTPVGYRRDTGGQLVVDPESAPIVVAAFEARAAGAPMSDVAEILGAKSRQAARYTVTNRVYLGEVRSGDYLQAGAHEPLVGRALFEAAQHAKSASTPRDGKGGMLLSGLIRCAGCRYSLSAATTVGRYRCRCDRCEAKASVQAVEVEPLVEAAFMARYADVEAVQVEDDLSGLEARVADAEAELSAYVQVMRATDAGYRAGYDARAADLDTAKRDLADAAAASPAPLSSVQLTEHWPGATVAERRELLASAIEAVFIRQGGRGADRVRIVWRGESVELPRRGPHGNAVTPFKFAA